MDEPAQPRTLVEFPYVTVRLACWHCPNRRGRYRLARLAEIYGARAPLDVVLFELSRRCRWQVPPGTKRRKYVPYCRAYFLDLGQEAPDEPPPDAEPPVAVGPPKLRIVSSRASLSPVPQV